MENPATEHAQLLALVALHFVRARALDHLWHFLRWLDRLCSSHKAWTESVEAVADYASCCVREHYGSVVQLSRSWRSA